MTGTNYMGGKRNAAKARTRDSTGRIQRGFFGRQRLNILSKGIPRRTPDSPTSLKPSIPVIELAHATLRHKDLGTRERLDGKSSNDRTTTTTFATAPKTPESNKTKGSSSSGMARSRVLDVLDMKEPMFLRATLNRILTLPDLAGLSGTGYTSKRLRVQEDDDGYERTERKREKTTSLLNESQLFHPKSTPSCTSLSFSSDRGTGLKGNRDYSITKSTGDGLYAPPEDDELQLSKSMSSVARSNHSGAVNFGVSSLPPSSEQTSSSDIVSTLAAGPDMDFEDQDWDDSGLYLGSNQRSLLPQDAYEQSPIQSIAIPQDNYGDEIEAFDRSPRRCPRFAENNLYEHQDPWHTIGVVLGLSPVRPDDRILDEASEEQDVPFASIFQSLSENENKNSSLNGDIPSDIQNSDNSVTQLVTPYFSATEDEFDDGLDEATMSDAQGSRFALQQNSSLSAVQEDFEEQAHGTRPMNMDINFEALPHVNSPPRTVRTPSPVWESQSPFRVLLESKRTSIPSVNNCSFGSSRVSGSSALSRSSCSRSQSSLTPRTPSPRSTEETHSPFRMLLAARNRDQKKSLNLTDYSLGDSAPSSSVGTFELASSVLLKGIDGVFHGPCLFPEDAYEASDED